MHLVAAKRILRYLKGSLGYGVYLCRSSHPLQLVAYSDVDWAGCPDTRRSTTGFAEKGYVQLQAKGDDGYTKEVTGPEGVRILVATNAKPNRNLRNPLDRQFFTSFMDVLTKPQNSGKFNFTTQFPYYKKIIHKKGEKKLGKNVVFDMDMSAGDFLALLYLLKLPAEVINLKETFPGEVLGAVVLADNNSTLKSEFHFESIKVLATGDISTDGQLNIDEKEGKSVKVLIKMESWGYYGL
ncbi:hypothetical protein AgCh_018422 [Apium graveolens]